jgi:hypothetical protein
MGVLTTLTEVVIAAEKHLVELKGEKEDRQQRNKRKSVFEESEGKPNVGASDGLSTGLGLAFNAGLLLCRGL